MAAVRGKDAKLYYKVGGQSAGGGYTELPNVRDLTYDMETEEGDASTRASDFKRYLLGMDDLKVEFDMVYDEADTGMTAIKDAWWGKTLMAFQILSATAGQGVQADFWVKKFSVSQPLSGPQIASISLLPAYSDDPPVEV